MSIIFSEVECYCQEKMHLTVTNVLCFSLLSSTFFSAPLPASPLLFKQISYLDLDQKVLPSQGYCLQVWLISRPCISGIEK